MKKIKMFLLAFFGAWVIAPAQANDSLFPTQPLWVGAGCKVSSASSLEANSRYLQEGSLVYQALFESDGWVGEVRALSLNSDGSVARDSDDSLKLKWSTNGTFNHDLAGDPPPRVMLTYNGEKGSLFQWKDGSDEMGGADGANELTPLQKFSFIGVGEALDSNSEIAGQERLKWLQGFNDGKIIVKDEVENEVLRDRQRLLGDIVNSNLLYIAAQDFGYYYDPTGSVISGSSADSYSSYLDYKAKLSPLVLVGANDGMLHAFDAESGIESFAYVPLAMYEKLRLLWSESYSHSFYVDGSVGVGDVYSGGWKTYIAGGFGYGGKGIFSLNVTDRSFDESDVLWERTGSSDSTDSWHNLGHVFGEPTIARTTIDSYVTLFGNGYKSSKGVASLYVVDANSGALKNEIIVDTAGANGLSTATAFLDASRRVTHVYAGDLLGNLWRFFWNGSGWSSRLLFSAGTAQPITGKVSVVSHPQGGRLVVFGTGRYLYQGDNASGATQSLYGIWDNDSSGAVLRSSLLEQKFLGTDAAGYRALTQNAIDWATHRGWYLELGSGERVLSAPSVSSGRAFFTTFTPANPVSSIGCTAGDSWIVGVDILSGGRLGYSIFDKKNDQLFNTEDFVACDNVGSCAPSAYKLPVGSLDGHGSLLGVGVDFGYSSGLDGSIEQFDLRGSGSPGRMSWRQLR